MINEINEKMNEWINQGIVQVDDQMKLLEDSWSEMLILDHLHHRLHNNLPDESALPNGQKFDLLQLALLGVHNMTDKFLEVTLKICNYLFRKVSYLLYYL